MVVATLIGKNSAGLCTLQSSNGDIVSNIPEALVVSKISCGELEVTDVTVSDGRMIYKGTEQESSSRDAGGKASEIRELVDKLNEARRVYEQGKDELMSNKEYDELYDKLVELEKETGIVLGNSPTINVGYEVVSGLPKISHEYPMLSLDKTKSVDALKVFASGKEIIGSVKLDGLTVVLTYENGELKQAVTRGNGEVGELVTSNAKRFIGVPSKIPYTGKMVLRGEAIISYKDFDEVNTSGEYKNPRNLCSGTVRQLDSSVVAKRRVRFIAFNLVYRDNDNELTTVMDRLAFLRSLGFSTVESISSKNTTIENVMDRLEKYVESSGIPSDGLVFTYNDVAYGKSLGTTAKFPRHSIAFKWQDETVQTVVTGIDWDTSRYGTLTPVVVFEPVELEGTTVSRASLHNLNIMAELEIGYGDVIEVYKANMIIPQVSNNLTRSGTCGVPSVCPFCGKPTEIQRISESGGGDTLVLKCNNPNCGRMDNLRLSHFVSRDAMNIVGMSERTLATLTEYGFITDELSIYKLSSSAQDICRLEGFGVTSVINMLNAIEKSRDVKLDNFIYALGIPNVGLQTAKVLCEHFDDDIVKLFSASYSELVSIDSIGDVIAGTIYDFIKDMDNVKRVAALAREMRFIKSEPKSSEMSGLTFCVTGAVNIFKSRKQVQAIIESKGGKLTGSVSASTSYLITNDTTSGSAKNKNAKLYGIPILTEKEFIEKFNIQV